MALLHLQQISQSYGAEPLLDNASLTIHEGDHLCLLGRNGAGKSTLLKIIAGELQPDDGRIQVASHLKIERLSQELPEASERSVYDYVSSGFESSDDSWQSDHHVQRVLGRLNLDGNLSMAKLSGGNRRLVALAKCLVTEPDLLLLDEPTNHLDIERIQWLEKNLGQLVKTWVVITHDRQFANAMSSRIVELDRGQLTAYEGNLKTYYKIKEVEEATEARERERQDKKLAQEETWIRQGIKARRTRNEGRVRALKALRKQVAGRRNKQGSGQILLNQAKGSGKRVFELDNISKSYDDNTLFRDFNLTLLKGDRLGILGRNGSGKTTLLKIMLGLEQPDTGTVKIGTELNIAYFDQTRDLINVNKTVFDNIADGNQYVQIGDKSIHVMGYLQNYLFTPNRARSPASALSGGEFSRLMLAKLMTQPFNLLILDEPTNDLDLETLEILETQLTEYTGTLIIISHDREFVDNTVTSVIHIDGRGSITENVGGYSDWYNKFGQQATNQRRSQQTEATKQVKSTPKQTKLTYNDQRELDQLPEKIEQLETSLTKLTNKTNDASFYNQEHDIVDAHFKEIAALEAEIESAYSRWESLSNT